MTTDSLPRLQSILKAGSIIGVMDGIAASLFSVARGGTPQGVFRYVASGLFGSDALNAGVGMVVIGLVFHFIVAIGWTGWYFLLAKRARILTERWAVSGIAYGFLVWIAMNYVVVPLSRVASRPISFTIPTAIMILIHLFVIGVPIAWLARRDLRQE